MNPTAERQSKFEYLSAVLAALGGKWPYGGALADASSFYSYKTVEECVLKIQERADRKAKRAR